MSDAPKDTFHPDTVIQTVNTSPHELPGDTAITVTSLLISDDLEGVRRTLAALHPADAMDVITHLEAEHRLPVLQSLYAEQLSPLLAYFDDTQREEFLPALGIAKVAQAVSELDTDDAVDIINEYEPDEQESLLAAMAADDRIILQQSLNYPEDSAGRLMQRDLVAVPIHWTVGQTIDFLRSHQELPDDFYEIFVLDPKHKPVGVIPLSRLMRALRPTEVNGLMFTDFRTIQVSADQEEVAFLFRKYGYVSLGVVDETGCLVGVVTVDDVVTLIDEEADKDMLALAGVSESDYAGMYRATLTTAQSRFWWLLLNLFTAILASAVISLFSDTLEHVIALAVLMPIVASMGGNAGTQTLTVIVRALAMRQIDPRKNKKVLIKEGFIGLINGILFAVVAGIVSWLWFHDLSIAFVMALAMIINLVVANLSGALIPLTLKKLGADPAIASSIFLTTVTDVVGFLVFLGLASAFVL